MATNTLTVHSQRYTDIQNLYHVSFKPTYPIVEGKLIVAVPRILYNSELLQLVTEILESYGISSADIRSEPKFLGQVRLNMETVNSIGSIKKWTVAKDSEVYTATILSLETGNY